MKRLLWIVFFLCFIFYPGNAGIIKFIDLNFSDFEKEDSKFYLGCLELGFEKEFDNEIYFEGAVDVEGGEIFFGQTIIEKRFNKQFGIKFGLMDMPFGIDWQVCSAPDRKTISSPITTDLLLGEGWADVGVDIFGEFKKVMYDFYVVNGFGQDEKGNPIVQTVDNNNDKSFGGRFEIIFFKNNKLGFSFMKGAYLDNNNEDELLRTGFHIQGNMKCFGYKAEVIKGRDEKLNSNTYEHDGMYFQVHKDFSKNLYCFLRYGNWVDDKQDESRISTGIGYKFLENIVLKFEYQRVKKATTNLDNILSQMVILF